MENPRLLGLSASLWVILCATAFIIFSSGCHTAKYLDEDQYLVKKNKVALAKGTNVEDWRTISLELQQQILTQPNGNFFFVYPREWFYLRGQQKDDTSRYQNFVQRIIAEEPAYLDTTLLRQSTDRLRTYMLNRGYFNAMVRTQIDTTEQHGVRTKFIINPGKEYRYDSIQIETVNDQIRALLLRDEKNRVLKPGNRVDSRDYDREVVRIVSLLRNNGFAYFYANSIAPLEADSVGQKVNATLSILPPEADQKHKTFRIGNITVFPDNDPLATSTRVAVDTVSDGVRFIYSEESLDVNPGTLADNIFFRSGDLFDQSSISKTNLQLNNLGVFRSVTIQQALSTDSESEIDFFIQLSQNERWETGADVELSFTDRQTVDQTRLSLIGGQVSGSLGNRNVRGGGERLSFALNAGLEFNFANIGNPEIQRLNTVEFGGTVTYSLPRFVDYFGMYRGLNRVKSGEDDDGNAQHFITDKFYTALTERGTTRLQVSANYVSLLNFYQTLTLSGSVGYQVTLNPNDQYTINHLGLDYFRLNPEDEFLPILNRTPFLRNSLGDQVFTGFLFRNISFARINPVKSFKPTWTVLGSFEQSGFELFMANKISNAIQGNDNIFELGPDLDYARYVRAIGSLAVSIPVGQGQSIAMRGQMGAAVTYGYLRRETDVPYVRQFFGGGNSSMRGWNARGVGPGGYRDDFALNDPNVADYQQANFKIELNAEYRAFLTRVSTTSIEGALFMDAGNIWTLNYDDSRPGSQFRFTDRIGDDGTVINEPFYEQIAINTGVGIRWDIAYVLLRLDMGIKIRNPYEIGGTHFPRSFSDDNQSRVNWALGLNYPF